MIFKFKVDEQVVQWWRDYYEVEADSETEAIKSIVKGYESPYDSVPLLDDTKVLRTIISDNSSNKLYDSKYEQKL